MGYSAVRVHTESDASGRRVIDRWFAPSLGCLLLKEHKQFLSNTGQLLGINSLRAEDVVLGEPAPELFEVSPEAREAPPSAAIQALHQLLGRSCPDCFRNTGEMADQSYYRRGIQ
jgi:hypothetical protein